MNQFLAINKLPSHLKKIVLNYTKFSLKNLKHESLRYTVYAINDYELVVKRIHNTREITYTPKKVFTNITAMVIKISHNKYHYILNEILEFQTDCKIIGMYELQPVDENGALYNLYHELIIPNGANVKLPYDGGILVSMNPADDYCNSFRIYGLSPEDYIDTCNEFINKHGVRKLHVRYLDGLMSHY